MTDEEINETIALADTGVACALTEPQKAKLRAGVVKMARTLRGQPREAYLDDAARYLRALWPHGERMMFDTETRAGCAWLRWDPKQGPVMSVSVPLVEGEAPSATLARLVARLREMAVAERDAAEARATTLRAVMGSIPRR